MSDRKIALITGASGGLGLEFAKLFAKDGHDVALVARRRDRLEEIAAALAKDFGIRASVFPADLTDPTAPKQIYDQVTAAGISIEFLVNNAGFGASGPFVDSDIQRQLDMIEVDVRAPVHLTRLFLPGMVERKSGRVLNIGSLAGFLPGPFMATYYASKAFVISFTEGLAYELHGTGVTATLAAPGATATEFAAVAGNDKSALFKGGAVADAASVALHAYRAMMAGKAIAIPGLRNKLTVQVLRVSTRSMARTISARLNQPRA